MATAALAAVVGAAFATLLISAAPASAQGTDDASFCTQSDPCPWTFDVDANGFVDFGDGGEWNFTVGSWVQMTIGNQDSVTHKVSLADYGVSVTIAADDLVDSTVFQLSKTGTSTVTDSPSGKTAPVRVLSEAETDAQDGVTASPTTSKSPLGGQSVSVKTADPCKTMNVCNTSDAKGAAGPGSMAVLVGVVGAAVFVARRK